MPERKPPLKIFSKKELKRSRIDRKYRRGVSFETVEDLGTHFEKRSLSFPKDLDINTTPIPKERSKYYYPISLGNQINIVMYQDSGHIFSYRSKDRRFIGKHDDSDLIKLTFDVLKYYNGVSINTSSGEIRLKGDVAKYIRVDYRKKLTTDFIKQPKNYLSFYKGNKKQGEKHPVFSRKRSTYKYIYNKLRSLTQK